MSRIRASLVVGASAALLIGLSAVPGTSQTDHAHDGESVVAVSGSATGAFVEAGLEEPSGDALTLDDGLVAAVQSQDPAAIEAALAQAGIDLGDVGAEVFLTGTFGPAPTVELPSTGGGPITDSAAEVSLVGDFDPPFVELLEVSTEGSLGATGRAVSSVTATNVNPLLIESFLFAADLVEVECSSDLTGAPVATTRVVDGDTLGEDVPEFPDPNTVVLDIEVSAPVGGGVLSQQAFLIANEQVVGDHDISVTGLRGFFVSTFTPEGGEPETLLSTDTVVAQAECGVVPGVEIVPTFTG